jgi:hypothetical protein
MRTKRKADICLDGDTMVQENSICLSKRQNVQDSFSLFVYFCLFAGGLIIKMCVLTSH